MKTVISYFDPIGRFLREVDSKYMNYRVGDTIDFDYCRYKVREVRHDESTGIKKVSAYMTLP